MLRGLAVAVGLTGFAYTLWPQRPNVLLITVDALRPDFLSCYGGTHSPTPHFDALAASGVMFTDAVCDVPWTRASIASLMTGRYATGHGVRAQFDQLPEDRVTMAEIFEAAGYQTGAVVSSFLLDHIFQMDQGFETYDDRFDAPMVVTSTEPPLHLASVYYGDRGQDRLLRRQKLQTTGLRDDVQTTDSAIGWLRRVGRRPFFLWVHYFGAHERWKPGAELQEMIAEYQPSVLRADNEVGRLLHALADLGLDQNTLVILHADHGQGLLEHSSFGHGTDLYEPSLHVPLIMRWPHRLPAGRRVDALTALVDVLPTILDLVGLPVPSGINGRSVATLWRGDGPPPEREVYCESFFAARPAAPTEEGKRAGVARYGVRGPRWKYIRNEPIGLTPVPGSATAGAQRSEELYDLQLDPQEGRNLIREQVGVAAKLRATLAGFRQTAPD